MCQTKGIGKMESPSVSYSSIVTVFIRVYKRTHRALQFGTRKLYSEHVLQGCIALYLKTLTKQFVKFKLVKRVLI